MAINGTTNTTNLDFVVEYGEGMWQDTGKTTAAEATDPLELWEDQSPNGYDATQTITASQPTVGTESVEGDGSNDYLIADSAGSIGEGLFTLYLVVDLTSGGNDVLVSFGNSAADESCRISYNGTTLLLRNVSDTETVSCGDTVNATKQVVVAKVDATTQYLFSEGSLVDSIALPTGTTTRDRFSLFVDRDNLNGGFSAYPIFACYLYSEAHDDTERGGVEDELTAYWLSSDQSVTLGAITQDYVVSNLTASNAAPQSKTLGVITLDLDLSDTTASNDTAQSIALDGQTLDLVIPDLTAANDTPQSKTLGVITLNLDLSDAGASNATPQAVAPDGQTLDFVLSDLTANNDTPQSKTLGVITLDFNLNDAIARNAGAGTILGAIDFDLVVPDLTVATGTPQTRTLDLITLDYTVPDATPANGTPQSKTLGLVTMDYVLSTLTTNAPQDTSLWTASMVIQRPWTADTVIELPWYADMEIQP